MIIMNASLDCLSGLFYRVKASVLSNSGNRSAMEDCGGGQ